MSKRFVAIIIAIVVGLGAVFWFTSKNSPSSTSNNSNATPSNHVFGKGTKAVTLTEYGDYECPACYSYEPIVEQIRAKYENDIFFKFRNFPIVSKHPNAFAGARAAEAAALQGKFWEMHDKLYQNQDPNGQVGWVASSTPLTFFTQFAQQLGLDINKFKQDYSSSAVNDVINADMSAGRQFGVNATPTFDLDGRKVETTEVASQAAFFKLIDQEIAAKSTK